MINRGLANFMILNVVPDQLIGIQLRRIRRKAKNLQFSGVECDTFLNRAGLVNRMTVEDENDRTLGSLHQPMDELAHMACVHPPRHNHKSQLSPRAHRRYHVQTESRSRCLDKRGATFERPGGPCMKVRPNSRFIPKKDIGPDLLCQGPDPGILLIQPLLDQGRALLKSTIQRPLTSQTQLRQQPPYGDSAQPNLPPFPNQISNHLPRPQCKGKLHLQRVLCRYRFVNPSHLRSIQLRRPSLQRLCLQRIPPAAAIAGQPVVNAHSAEAKCTDHFFRTMTGLNLFNGAYTNCFQSFVVELSCIILSHRLILSHKKKNVNLLMYSLVNRSVPFTFFDCN